MKLKLEMERNKVIFNCYLLLIITLLLINNLATFNPLLSK